jgi:SAM-dependent methyltransferase
MLDIGAASGIAVHWFQQRGWEAMGVEVAGELARAGQEKFKINMKIGNFLDLELPAEKLDLVTMFASIEHLAEPHLFFKKISYIIKKGGRLILTTCRADTWGFRIFFGRSWRFFNVPEHLFYFSSRLLLRMAENNGFGKIKLITYGSGLSGRKKKIGDFLARHLGLGDMMALILEKK